MPNNLPYLPVLILATEFTWLYTAPRIVTTCKQGSAQEYLSGGLNCYGVCYIRVYLKWISEKCKSSTGRISEGGGRILEGTGQLSHCRPVWAEPCVSKPPIDCRNKDINIVCEKWVVVEFEQIFVTKVVNTAAFNQVNMVVLKKILIFLSSTQRYHL